MALIRIGTRGSPLALAQAHETKRRMAEANGGFSFEIVVIKTSGDLIQDRALSEAGGKGLFTKEIDAAMLRGEIDVAVHSSKDLPTALPEGIGVAGYLPREDARDALISAKSTTLAGLPQGGTLGTASLRRQAQAKRLRPDLNVGLLRGNVETRLGKAERGEIDATLLAYAGLKRLGFAHRATALLEIDDFLPAVGQGAIGITARPRDEGAARRAGADPRSGDRRGARVRARLPRRARRLLQDADRRQRPDRGRGFAVSRRGLSRRWVGGVRGRALRAPARRRRNRRRRGAGCSRAAAERRAGGLTLHRQVGAKRPSSHYAVTLIFARIRLLRLGAGTGGVDARRPRGEVDLALIAEEIESLGKAEKRELISRLTALLLHFLKWTQQPALRGNSSPLSIANARDEIADLLADTPSLKAQLDEIVSTAYRYARRKAAAEMDMPDERLPAACPWTFAAMTDESFWPA